MAAKYGKYFVKNPIVPGQFCPRLVYFSRQHPEAGEKDFSVLWNCITEPFLMVKEAHSHDFTEFDAVIEMSLGEEAEKHLITEPTVLYIPKGMMHCPLNFKVVNKPVIFMNVALTPQYLAGPPGTPSAPKHR
jgi:hypothetical protein